MICGMEIGLAIFGIIALVRGRMTMSKTKVVVGAPARLLGLVAMTPLPLAFTAGLLYGISKGVNGVQNIGKDEQMTLTLIEAGIVIGVAIFVFVIGAAVAISPEEAERRERGSRYENDYDDEYDRPRRRGRDEEDQDDEYDRRGRRRDRDDDEDDRDSRRDKPWNR